MKTVVSSTCAALFCAVLLTPAVAKTTNPVTQVSTWTGTWNCAAGKTTYTENFVPLLGGKAMRVSVSKPYASEGVATFDSGRNAWFYTFVNGDGTYATMTGPASGSTVAFRQVFPSGNATDNIRLMSASNYSSTYIAISGRKKLTIAGVCKKT